MAQESSSRKSPEEAAVELYSKTSVITQGLQKDIIEFLSSKYTANATITVPEVMKFYDCPEDRAVRVIKGLVAQGVLKPVGKDSYKVII